MANYNGFPIKPLNVKKATEQRRAALESRALQTLHVLPRILVMLASLMCMRQNACVGGIDPDGLGLVLDLLQSYPHSSERRVRAEKKQQTLRGGEIMSEMDERKEGSLSPDLGFTGGPE